jgi:hypothetical protein
MDTDDDEEEAYDDERPLFCTLRVNTKPSSMQLSN